ncbi:MAG: hypothetical protein WBS20_18055 [Lysobacterales bacterium]
MLKLSANAPDDFSHLGQTIFISPYSWWGQDTDSLSSRFNKDLPEFVYHKISAFTSGLNLSTQSIDISVEKLDEQITAAEGERVLVVGKSLNALGVITGDGELVEGQNGDDYIGVTSVFRTIPYYQDVGRINLEIEDRIPSKSARPSQIGKGLDDFWGKQALLSVVLQRLAVHKGDWNPDELNRLSDILVGVRNTMKVDDQLLELTEKLLQKIEAERRS